MVYRTCKILKLVLFFGVFAYMILRDYSNGTLKLSSVTTGLVIAAVIYLFLSYFGFVLLVTRNYIMTIMIAVPSYIYAFFYMDKISSKVTWFTDTVSMALLITLTLLLVVSDIIVLRTR